MDAEGFTAELKRSREALARPAIASSVDQEAFAVKDKCFTNQYAGMYFSRLSSLTGDLKKLSAARWPGVPFESKLLGLKARKRCVVIGTLYKKLKLRPSVLEEFKFSKKKKKKRGEKDEAPPSVLFSEDDELVLEDSHARIPVVLSVGAGSLPPTSELVSGIVVAMVGCPDESGTFLVEQMELPGVPPQDTKQAPPADDVCVALVSGLQVGGDGGGKGAALRRQLLAEYLSGLAGSRSEQERAARVAQVIFAGNSICMQRDENIEYAHFNKANRDQAENTRNRDMKETLDNLDAWLTSLASSLNVIVMPGAKDPANFTLPQDELPSFFFPTASTYSTLQRATNPCLASVAGRRLLGTAGQNIDDLAKQSAAKGPIDHLERTLRWRHVAPTAPDTLGCYSFDDSDPFVIEKCPHVYFAGNQDTFASRLVEGPQGQKCRIVTLPSFAKTGSIAMVNLRTLDCWEVKLGAAGPKPGSQAASSN